MSDKKISQLTAAITPLAGTEVLPIVQSGSTVKVPVSDITTGRAVSAASLTLTGSPLPTASGGTGLASFTANGVPYASSSSALTTGTALNFNGAMLGIGGAVSAWRSGARGVQFGANRYGALWEQANGAVDVSFAAYEDGTNTFKYTTTGDSPTLFSTVTGAWTWSNAGAGTAGNAVTWTQRLGLDSSGNLTADTGDFVLGTAGKGLKFAGNSNVIWRVGAGTPEGAVTAPIGSLFTRTDGGAGTTLYVKESGAGNTGWVAK